MPQTEKHDEFDGIPFAQLSKEGRDAVALDLAKGKSRYRIGLLVPLILAAALPFFTDYNKDKDRERAQIIEKSQHEASAAFSLSKTAIEELAAISGEVGKLNQKNNELNLENDSLRKALEKLTLDYKELEKMANVSITERGKIKEDLSRVSQFQKKEETTPAPEK